MTSRATALLGAVVVAAATTADLTRATEDDDVLARLRQLENAVKTVSTVQAEFVQEKRLAVFEHTVVLRGRMAMVRGRKLAWHVESPVRHSMVLDGERMLVWDEDTDDVQTVNTRASPAFKALFGQIRAWFSGEYALLAEDYDVSVRGETPLTFVFTPRSATGTTEALREVAVVVGEDQRYLQALRMQQVGGDSTVIRFSNTKLDTDIPASAWDIPPQ